MKIRAITTNCNLNVGLGVKENYELEFEISAEQLAEQIDIHDLDDIYQAKFDTERKLKSAKCECKEPLMVRIGGLAETPDTNFHCGWCNKPLPKSKPNIEPLVVKNIEHASIERRPINLVLKIVDKLNALIQRENERK